MVDTRTTRGRPRRYGPRVRWLRTAATVVALGMLAAACGEDDPVATPAPAEDTAADDAGAGEDPDPVDEEAASDDGDAAAAEDPSGDDAAADLAPAPDPLIDTPLSAADGWVDPVDVDIPDHGRAVLQVDGGTYEFDVRCFGTGEVTEDAVEGDQRLIDLVLFRLSMSGSGVSEDGTEVSIIVERGIHIADSTASNIALSEFGGDGQFDTVRFSGMSDTASVVASPTDLDPDGDLLPIVQPSPEGVVTAQGELRPDFSTDEDAPAGPFTFAGRCQDTWPDDEIEISRG